MPRHETRRQFAENPFRGLDHRALGAAHIGENGLWLEVRLELPEDRFHGANGHAEHNHLGALHRGGDIRLGTVDDAQILGLFQRLRGASVTDHLGTGPGRLQRPGQ